jgi:hypothetical protein
MSNQVDLTPGTAGNSTGLHVHTPVGHSASENNNPSDAPGQTKNASGGPTVVLKVKGADGQSNLRFANPS